VHNFNFNIERSVSNSEILISVVNLTTQFYTPRQINFFMRISIGAIYPICIEGAIVFFMQLMSEATSNYAKTRYLMVSKK
jgi:hypothetical protein